MSGAALILTPVQSNMQNRFAKADVLKATLPSPQDLLKLTTAARAGLGDLVSVVPVPLPVLKEQIIAKLTEAGHGALIPKVDEFLKLISSSTKADKALPAAAIEIKLEQIASRANVPVDTKDVDVDEFPTRRVLASTEDPRAAAANALAPVSTALGKAATEVGIEAKGDGPISFSSTNLDELVTYLKSKQGEVTTLAPQERSYLAELTAKDFEKLEKSAAFLQSVQSGDTVITGDNVAKLEKHLGRIETLSQVAQ